MDVLEGLEFLSNVKPTSMKKKTVSNLLYLPPFESTSSNSYSNLLTRLTSDPSPLPANVGYRS